MSAPVLLSTLGQAAIQLFALIFLIAMGRGDTGDSMIECTNTNEGGDRKPSPCHYNTMVFYFSNFQYILVSICFSIAKPFRKEVSTNKLYYYSLYICVAFSLFLMLVDIKPLDEYFELVSITKGYSVRLLIYVCVMAVVSYSFERVFMINYTKQWQIKREKSVKETREVEVQEIIRQGTFRRP